MVGITPSTELCAIVERWLRAYASGDKETVTNLFSADPAMTYIGSADNERLHGLDVPRRLALYMDDFPDFDLEPIDAHGFTCGPVGWVDWNMTTKTSDNERQIEYRSTFIFTLESGIWKIVYVHNSNPVSNMQSLGFQSRAFEQLLDAALDPDLEFTQTGLATIMFTDIADSTTIAETIGDARWSGAVNAHVAAVGRIITDHGGTLVKSLGDGTMSSFPSARAALSAATALQLTMAANDGEPRLQIRVGLHTGDLVEQDGDMFGTVVNKAARIAAIAAPGDIRVSDATRIMVGSDDFAFTDAITVPLKGLNGDHVIHRLEWRP